MSQQIEAKDAVRRTIIAAASQERAFQVFTEQLGTCGRRSTTSVRWKWPISSWSLS